MRTKQLTTLQRLAPLVLAVALAAAGCSGDDAPDEEVQAAADVRVPDVVGIPYADARAELKALGFPAERELQPSAEPQGTVTGQSVGSSELVPRGTTVSLTVSSGPAADPATTSTSSAPVRSTTTVAPASWASTFEDVSSGVVRVDTVACLGTGTGSGFLIGEDLVATNAHVVQDSVSVELEADGERRTGEVIGIDVGRDLALVRADRPFGGQVLGISTRVPAVGEEVAALGYPQAQPLSFTVGTVSGLDRVVDFVDDPLTGLIQTDAAVNPGNSGGPLIGLDGTVVGVVVARRLDSEGIGYAIPGPEAIAALDGWRADPSPPPAPVCDEPTGGSWEVTSLSDHPEAPEVVALFEDYVLGINSGDYELAYGRLSPQFQEGTPYEQFVEDQTTSYLYDLVVLDVVDGATQDELEVDVDFWSEQAATAGPDGQTCSEWAIAYRLVRLDATWLIDGAEPREPWVPRACGEG